MPALVTTCPHCATKHVSLNSISAYAESEYTGVVFLLCPNCSQPSCARLMMDGKAHNFNHVMNGHISFNNANYKILHIWLKPPEPQIPQSLPEAVARAMLQAEANFIQEGHEEASGVMYRRALELGLKSIATTMDGTLAKRISKLGDQGKLTPALVAWAGEIRHLGNDSAHDDEITDRKELAALRGLTDMVLQYLFSIPALVAARKAESAK